ncbi:hypothetical protein EV361DRAFT_795873 [Lentinula raphanica]|nr:hypothetical protein EV361DRAFT_795873 [Lentinula raphanica]
MQHGNTVSRTVWLLVPPPDVRWYIADHIKVSNVDSSVKQRRVVSVVVHACRSEALAQGHVFPVAHFRLFLVLDPPPGGEQKESVELNNFGHMSLVTTTEIAYHPYKFSRTTTFLTVALVQPLVSPTVGEILDYLFNEKKRHLYKLDSATGSGCRYWCQTVLSDMAHKGWLNHDAHQQTEQVALFVQQNERGVLISEVGNPTGGSFYG